MRLNDGFMLSGAGLHTGRHVDVRVLPAGEGMGRRFIRIDIAGQPEIAASVRAVRPSQLSTLLVEGEATIQTVEHLLAALAGLGVADARIEVTGPELPILDGSALPWAEAITRACVRLSDAIRISSPVIEEPLWVRSGDAFVAALPAEELRLTYGIDFPPPIGNQWFSFCPERDDFCRALAPARTFALLRDVERLRAAGLIQGGSLEGAIVCGPEGWLNPPLRFEDEPVRHKVLDLLGDLSLLGVIPRAHYVAYKAGHRLHVEMARSIEARALRSER
jgi:UDP-3-O-[3-hydroxymyristoyl] N-acetylglucosamine deacetylase